MTGKKSDSCPRTFWINARWFINSLTVLNSKKWVTCEALCHIQSIRIASALEKWCRFVVVASNITFRFCNFSAACISDRFKRFVQHTVMHSTNYVCVVSCLLKNHWKPPSFLMRTANENCFGTNTHRPIPFKALNRLPLSLKSIKNQFSFSTGFNCSSLSPICETKIFTVEKQLFGLYFETSLMQVSKWPHSKRLHSI